MDVKMDGSVGGWVGAWLDVSNTESIFNSDNDSFELQYINCF